MPELPEVETLCRQLQEKIVGRVIRSKEVYDEKLSGLADVRGREVTDVRRIGKTVVCVLDDGRRLVVHLRMSGRLLWRTEYAIEPHTRLRLGFAEGCVDLVDPRRFATVCVAVDNPETCRNDFITGFDRQAFLVRQALRRVAVKLVLMDQAAVAGIGNIYACEILHRARVSPLRPAAEIKKEEWNRIFRQARRVLQDGIEKRGTSISDWRDLYGCPGENQYLLAVYGREGKACPVCGEVITRIRQGGRSTFYCPRCQA
ncbi:MAG: bifunctional DNA-formamidopyrimidine glycosylase/DNA-(apurinic or apyrimidinic site) lyase [Smithellaceae bacterium]|nr:bifunctional DNA-formamidopyrimidine glycosylase/DNA-(apurinic or apyrimidinic site) lyase [Syntrophaceae bacterium]MDD4240151.1 bifunctional DNA-formamidopyrimidine glycosylase/DNA-(apurinic or apyrimidinic site) lyase [Smithellaceae bacterium]NLX51351.1 bifunctional DNA-formamidopyrimidine glycosylase/DNA-(apurinic or apyrimidinic site) lyase [Deltaproteobacteria bacterium]